MTHSELKAKICELVKSYFGGATITWSMTGAVRGKAPLVVLDLGDIVRPYQPLRLNKNGIPVDVYPSAVTLQVDLFTKGAPRTVGNGITEARENTAVTDLTDFLNFVNSPSIDDWCELNDIALNADTVRDLTQLINDTSWDFRAMVEIKIGFTQSATGYTGINYEGGVEYDENGMPVFVPPGQQQPPFAPTPSGGRTQELADSFTGWFDRVYGPQQDK